MVTISLHPHARILSPGVVFCFAFIAVAALGNASSPKLSAQQNTTPSTANRPQPVSTFDVDGSIGHQVQGVLNNWLLVAPQRNPQMLGMYLQRDKTPYNNLLPWSGEFAGKYLTACVEILRIKNSEELKNHTADFVEKLIGCQAEDGYLGPFPLQHRLTGWAPNTDGRGGDTWDAWGHYHVMLGLLSWHQLTQDVNALESAIKIADLLDNKFSGLDRTVLSTRNPEMNQAILHSLALLYEVAPQEKYLNLANEIVAEFSLPGSGDYLRAGLSNTEFYRTPKPRWESLHPMLGLAEMYWITGNVEYKTAVENLWWSMLKLDRHNNGGFSSGEQATGDPYDLGAIETCCTIAWMALSTAVLHLTDDPRVADELELSLFNQVQALHSPDGAWCTYNTPMDGIRINSTDDIAFQIRPGSEELNCCSVNAARGFGLTADWATLTSDRGITINYYGQSRFETTLQGSQIHVRQTTQYPLGNKVKLHFSVDRPTSFQCRFRIPHWSKQTVVQVNGEEITAAPGQYASVDRTWSSGDTVEIEFDFNLRLLAGENACAGQASIYRGPILLALDTPSAPAPRFSPQFQRYGSNLYAANSAGAHVEFDFIGDKITWIGQMFDDAGIAKVEIDGRQVATVNQFDAQRGTPFRWSHDQCGPGPHTIRIEVLKENNVESKGNFINVIDFEPKLHRPKITADELAISKLTETDQSFVLNVQSADDTPLAFVPYRDAGRSGTPYFTWITMDNVPLVPFSRGNPSRTIPVKH